MKPLLFNILLFQLLVCSAQQNLVVNGSFEEIDSCYGDGASLGFDVFQWSGCTGWSCPTYASSDLWCDNPVWGGQQPPNIPGLGYQFPRTGNNMAGFGIFTYVEKNYREYIQNELSEELNANRYYKISMYVSPGRSEYNNSSCLQLHLSETPVSQPGSYNYIPVIPQWRNNDYNYFTDTLNWQLVEGVFKASGGEKYLTIGCFDPISTMVIKDTNDFTTDDVYYFIDDVSLEVGAVTHTIPNVFTPNGDDLNDIFLPTIHNIPDWRLTVYNRWGNPVAKLDENNPSWDGRIGKEKATEGIYFFILESEHLSLREQGFFHLLR